MRINIVEMPRLKLDKPLEEMNAKERMIYYFLNCQNGDEDSKIKTMIESDEVIQMVEKRVNTIGEDRWKELQNFFTELHKQEEENERRLIWMKANKKVEEANKRADVEAKRADEQAKRADVAELKLSQFIFELSKTMS